MILYVIIPNINFEFIIQEVLQVGFLKNVESVFNWIHETFFEPSLEEMGQYIRKKYAVSDISDYEIVIRALVMYREGRRLRAEDLESYGHDNTFDEHVEFILDKVECIFDKLEEEREECSYENININIKQVLGRDAYFIKRLLVRLSEKGNSKAKSVLENLKKDNVI